MEIKILVATHQRCQVPQDTVYLPVHAGRALHPTEDYGYQGDDEGENISAKNPYYSELTAIYWAWKNLKADYIGLAHYRRHFSKKYKKTDWESILTSKEAEELCSKYDIILPRKRRYFIETLSSHYMHTHDLEHLHITMTREILEATCHDFLEAFDEKMQQSSGHMFNMFIMKYDLFCQYCTWLFPILATLETKIDLKSMPPYDARLLGRISELLLDVWIMKNKLQYKEINYVFLSKKNFFKKAWRFLMAKFFGRKYTESF